MNRTAKLIAAAATGLFLLASGPRAFSQSKMAPEPIKKVASASSKKSNGTRTLCTGDTLFLKGYAPKGAKLRLKEAASKNTKATNAWVASNGKPGYFSGRLTYKAGKVKKTIPVSVKFKKDESAYAYAPSQPSEKSPEKAFKAPAGYSTHRTGMRDFFRMSPLEDTRAYGGAVFFMDGYGVPNLGVNMDYRVKRLNDNWAIRSSVTMAVGAQKFSISGPCVALGDSAFREASARNIETYLSLGLEAGTGRLSVVLSPIIGVANSNGKFNETVYFMSSSGKMDSRTALYDFGRWKSFVGLMCSVSANFDVVKLTLFADAKWAMVLDGDAVPDPHAKRILNYGVSFKFPLRSFSSPRSRGYNLPSR